MLTAAKGRLDLASATLGATRVRVVPSFYVVADRIKQRITGKSTLPEHTLPHPTAAS